ncbi:hypothetical protein CDS [Bradyrhizobium sp.]|nr:hypothetical protein CDS [Bradyrhizobium sp.]
MGNGSIVPRQERFNTRHALCCMPVHAIEIGLARRLPHRMGQPAAPKRSPSPRHAWERARRSTEVGEGV